MLGAGGPIPEWEREVKEEKKEYRDYRRRFEYEVKKSGIRMKVDEYSDNLDAEMSAALKCILSVDGGE